MLDEVAVDCVPTQGGENRRILLDLKSVLEEVQAEVKREEEKRSELHLQFTRDRCAWELEKAELKCRITQVGRNCSNSVLMMMMMMMHVCVGWGGVVGLRTAFKSIHNTFVSACL